MDDGPRGWGIPLYERVLDRIGAGPAVALLDLGCGDGQLCRLAADRGSRVTGIDQDRSRLDEARTLVPEGVFEVGDILALPYPDAGFEAVSCVQSIMHVPNPLRAMREAARVAVPGAAVGFTIWGKEADCELRAFGEALSELLPRPARTLPQRGRLIEPPALSQDGRLAHLAALAGLVVIETGDVVCPFRYPDEVTLLRSLLGSALGQQAVRAAGEAAVRVAVLDGLAGYRNTAGGYQLDNTFRYLVARKPA